MIKQFSINEPQESLRPLLFLLMRKYTQTFHTLIDTKDTEVLELNFKSQENLDNFNLELEKIGVKGI